MYELKLMLYENEFRNVFSRNISLPQIDTIRDTLKAIEISGLKYIPVHTVKKAIKNKVFANGTIDGYNVAEIDGTKFFRSNRKCCPKCLTSTKNGKTQFYHYGSVMVMIGDGPKLVSGFQECKPGENYSKDEGK